MESHIIVPFKNKTMFLQEDQPSRAFQTFANMRLNGDLCDVTLIANDVKISAHRLILAANIPYFHPLFLNGMVESNQNEIRMHEVEPSALEALVCFAYTCEMEINEENVESLLIAADYLGMDQVSDACSTFMSKLINHSNALDIRKLAVVLNIVKLQKFANEYVEKNFLEISRSKAFLELPFSDVNELLEKDEIQVPTEQEVYRAAMAWIRQSPADRKKKLPELLRSVRMSFLSYSFLSACVASDDMIQKSKACLKLFHEAKDQCVMRDRPLACSFTTNPRNGKNYIYAVCRLNKETSTVVQRYDLYCGTWQMMNAKTRYVKDAAVVVMNKCLYVIGGCCEYGTLMRSVLVFDTELDSWCKKAPLQHSKMLVSAAVLSNKIYACGGKSHDGVINAVECFDPEANNWTKLPKMLQARCGACCVSLNEYLYVLGGYGGDPGSANMKCLNSVERYCPKSKQWITVSFMSTELYLRSAACLGGKLYVYGEVFIDVYDPQVEEWHRIANVKTSKTGFNLFVICGKLYAVGGSNSGTIDIYDPETGEWSAGKSLPQNMHFIGAGNISVY